MGANRQKRQHKERSPRLPGSAAARVCSPHPHPFPQSPPAPLQLRSRRCAGTAAIHPRLRSRARLRPPARPEGGVGGDPCNGHRAERFAVNNFLLGEGGCRDRCPTMELRSPPHPPTLSRAPRSGSTAASSGPKRPLTPPGPHGGFGGLGVTPPPPHNSPTEHRAAPRPPSPGTALPKAPSGGIPGRPRRPEPGWGLSSYRARVPEAEERRRRKEAEG